MSCKDFCYSSVLLLICYVCIHDAAVHDELPQCGLTGIYRTRQSVLESPNYPDNYPVNTCWDYVIRSPYRCPTKFHIQFLDFYLESSPNCTNDYLAIGLENDGDDMDVLCGQVVGIKKYHTPDGVLRLRFLSDDSPWTTGKGFKLLVTRLACETDELTRELSAADVDEDTVQVHTLPSKHMLPGSLQVPPIYQNLSAQDQHRPYPLPPLFSFQLPNQLSYPVSPSQIPTPLPPPANGVGGFYLPLGGHPAYLPQGLQGRPPPLGIVAGQPQPCVSNQGVTSIGQQQQQQQQQQFQLPQQLPQQFGQAQQQPQQQPELQQQQLPVVTDQYVSNAFTPQVPTLKDYDPQSLQQFGPQTELCCASSFSQQHFYLSSPGFPRTVFSALLPTQQRDCAFYLEKHTSQVCRLRIQFKFFDFGHNNQIRDQQTNYPQLNQPRSCTEDFIELDGQRFCGCRSGYVYKTHWPEGKKVLRMRMGYAGVPSNGFLLEVFQEQDQDGCRDVALLNPGVGQFSAAQFGTGQHNTGRFGVGLPTAAGFGALGLQQTNGGLYGINFAHTLYPQQVGYQPLPTGPWQAPAYAVAAPTAIGAYQLPNYRNSRRIDYARGIDTHQPVTVVETNSTRKEFYYYDGDEAFAHAANRADTAIPDEPDEPDVSHRLSTKAFEQSSCTFDYREVLRLSVDTLWLTKPICFAPLRSWFGNMFG